LSKEEIARARGIISIPSYELFPILNLAQSVNIVCYEFYKWAKSFDCAGDSSNDSTDMRPSSEALLAVSRTELPKRAEITSLLGKLELLLLETSYRDRGFRNNNSKEVEVRRRVSAAMSSVL
jgi:tRNA C32,U32 (ribose-2'-O)-methylase TrmJ